MLVLAIFVLNLWRNGPVARAEPDARGAAFSASPGAASTPIPRPRKVIVEPPPPIPDVDARQEATEANLQPNAERHGLALSAALVAWQQISTIDGADRGGGIALRLGATATPDTVVYLELSAGGFLNITKDASGGAVPRPKDSYIETSTALMVTAQTYVGPTLWLRAGGGFTSYTQVVPDNSRDMVEMRQAHGGLGAVTGIGLDVVRWRTTRLSLESIQSLQRFRTGWLLNLGFGLGLTYY
jgi:hypothetical protein